MRHLKALMLIVLTISVMLLALTSCETVENVVGQIPGIENILPHQHNFVEGKCECGEIDPEYVAPHVHEFVNGKCECGEVDPSFSCIDHVWSEPVLESEATCTKEGRYAITCTVCGYQRYTPIFELGHDDDEVIVEPTCTEAGLLTKTCKRCGDVREEPIEATGHALSEDVYVITTAPTCTENGVVTYPCANCDYTESYDIPAFGHEFIDGKCVECEAEYVAPAKGGWTLATELKTGDHVLIGNPGNGKLLSALKVSEGSFYNKGVAYSADDFANATDDEIWVVTVNDDGSYSFTALNGDKLALAESYSSLNATGVNDKWVLEDKGNGVYYLKNTGRNLYLEWYASKNNWSCYGTVSGNLFDISFYVYVEPSDEEHVHNHISDVHPTTCTEDGYTTYTCECGDTYTVEGDAATGHAYAEKVVAPTCTEAGYTEHTCGNCGDNYKTDEVAAAGHKYSEGTCSVCGGEDPDWHVHDYKDVVTLEPTCTVPGSKVPTCECGDTLAAIEIPVVDHVDANLDITCDFEGCTKRILPPADSKVSLFTARHMIVVTLNNNYYVEGVVTSVEDAKNGKFVITDDAGDTILIYLPVDANGLSHANWVSKVVVGDVVSVYGKPVNPSGLNTTQKAVVKSGVLTFIEKHPHEFGEPTCTKPGYCACGQDGPVALGHADVDGDNLCDACGWNVNHLVENVATKYDDVKNTDKVDTTAGTALWEGTNFNVHLSKGTGTFNTSGTDHMRYYKNNVLTITSTNGLKMVGITFSASSASYTDELEAFLTAIGATYTKDDLKYTIFFEATESVSFTNSSAKNCRIGSVEVIYEKPVVKAEPVTVTMANTITDVQSTNMTGGNDAELVGLDSSIFSVVADQGSYGGYPVLYYKSSLAAPSQIRMYNHSSANGNSITVSVAEGYEIVSIKITFAITGRANGYVITNGEGVEIANVATDATIENVEAIYDVNSGSFTLKNVHTGTAKQVWIASIEITYQEV